MSHRRRKGAGVWKTQLEAKVYEGSASCGAAGDLPLRVSGSTRSIKTR